MKIWGYIILLLPLLNYSQQLVKGKVTNEIDHDGIHVFNKTQSQYTITNANGEFEILAKEKDTIVFSAIQFELKEVVLGKKELQQPLSVFLTTKVNRLAAIYLGGYVLSGNLAKDVKNIKTKKRLGLEMTQSYGKGIGKYAGMSLLTDNQSPVVNETLGTSFEGINILPILEMLLPKKKAKIPTINVNRSRLQYMLGDAVFTTTLQLKEIDIERFIQFVEEDVVLKKTLNKNNPLALLERLVVLRKSFKTTSK